MAQTFIPQHERVDDVPLVIGLANRLRLAEILRHHLGTHGLHQGLHNGQFAVGWLAYILSQANTAHPPCGHGRTTSPTPWHNC